MHLISLIYCHKLVYILIFRGRNSEDVASNLVSQIGYADELLQDILCENIGDTVFSLVYWVGIDVFCSGDQVCC